MLALFTADQRKRTLKQKQFILISFNNRAIFGRADAQAMTDVFLDLCSGQSLAISIQENVQQLRQGISFTFTTRASMREIHTGYEGSDGQGSRE